MAFPSDASSSLLWPSIDFPVHGIAEKCWSGILSTLQRKITKPFVVGFPNTTFTKGIVFLIG